MSLDIQLQILEKNPVWIVKALDFQDEFTADSV